MAKKELAQIKLQIPAGQASPTPPVGPALGQHGVNIMEFCKAFNATTQDKGPQFHLHHQDATGGRIAEEGREDRKGIGCAESGQGWYGDAGTIA